MGRTFSIDAMGGVTSIVDSDGRSSFKSLDPGPVGVTVHDAYVAKRTSWFDPRDTEIAKLNRLLEEAHDEIRKAHNLLDARRDAGRERDVALYERDIAIRALAEVIQHFIHAPPSPPKEENPAVRAVRMMQNIGAAR
jgi:hypothetical protein